MWAKIVALRKESVDRNFCVVCVIVDNNVALRKESVDRNGGGLSACARGCRSLSARRAWIEIAGQPAHGLPSIVALRKESVDRNDRAHGAAHGALVALRKESVDRNIYTSDCAAQRAVALRKESVDRNA